MLTTWRRYGLALLLVMLGSAQARPQEEAGDPQRVIDALQLTGGSVVAEIGAGDAKLTLALARHVGEAGRVFTTELGREPVEALRKAVRSSGLSNIDVLDAHHFRTNLPEACCDGIVMRDVYHHFGDPAAMNASLLASLKPGGRTRSSTSRRGRAARARRQPAARQTAVTASDAPRSSRNSPPPVSRPPWLRASPRVGSSSSRRSPRPEVLLLPSSRGRCLARAAG